MKKEFVRESLVLTPEQWETLKELAALTESCPPSGSNAGKPSWRTFIKRIADKEITVLIKASDSPTGTAPQKTTQK